MGVRKYLSQVLALVETIFPDPEYEKIDLLWADGSVKTFEVRGRDGHHFMVARDSRILGCDKVCHVRYNDPRIVRGPYED